MEQAGKADFDLLEKKAIAWGEPKVGSAKQVTPILDCLGVIEFDVFVNTMFVLYGNGMQELAEMIFQSAI